MRIFLLVQIKYRNTTNTSYLHFCTSPAPEVNISGADISSLRQIWLKKENRETDRQTYKEREGEKEGLPSSSSSVSFFSTFSAEKQQSPSASEEREKDGKKRRQENQPTYLRYSYNRERERELARYSPVFYWEERIGARRERERSCRRSFVLPPPFPGVLLVKLHCSRSKKSCCPKAKDVRVW